MKITHITVTYQETFLNGEVWHDNCPQFISCGILLHLTHLLIKPGSYDQVAKQPWVKPNFTFY